MRTEKIDIVKGKLKIVNRVSYSDNITIKISFNRYNNKYNYVTLEGYIVKDEGIFFTSKNQALKVAIKSIKRLKNEE